MLQRGDKCSRNMIQYWCSRNTNKARLPPSSNQNAYSIYLLPVVASLSGPGGSTLRLFSALHGHLLLEKKIHSLSQGKKFEPDYLGASLAFLNDEGGDMMVLTNGCVVQRIARNGDIKWNWTSEDQAFVSCHLLLRYND